MLLYSLNARVLVMICAAICERRAGSPAASARWGLMAAFSAADAVLLVGRVGQTGRGGEPSASARSVSSPLRNIPAGTPVAFLRVLARARLIAFPAVMLVAKIYSPMRDSTGTRMRRKILWRMDRRRKPMAALASKCEFERIVTRVLRRNFVPPGGLDTSRAAVSSGCKSGIFRSRYDDLPGI